MMPVQRIVRAAAMRQHFVRRTVVEEQIFPDKPVALVKILRHAARPAI